MEMNRDHLNKILKQDEGDILTIYRDSLGYYTIGVGHLLTKENDMRKAIEILDKQVGRDTGGHITKDESTYLLQFDIDRIMTGINNSKIIAPVFNKLSGKRKLGLFSMCFQMGISGVEGFKNSLRYIDNGDWYNANQNLRKSKWFKQTPKRAERVINIITEEKLSPYRIFD